MQMQIRLHVQVYVCVCSYVSTLIIDTHIFAFDYTCSYWLPSAVLKLPSALRPGQVESLMPLSSQSWTARAMEADRCKSPWQKSPCVSPCVSMVGVLHNSMCFWWLGTTRLGLHDPTATSWPQPCESSREDAAVPFWILEQLLLR